MKKFLLLISVLFASIASFAQGELVSYDVTINKGDGYRMYIKSYPDAANDSINAKKKLVVKYTSADESIVAAEGNVIRGLAEGSCDITMQVSVAWPGTLDTFNPNSVVMEKTFKATVVENAPLTLPTFELSWGLPRQQAIDNQKSWGHLHITDSYLSHAPNVIENNPEYVARLEVFYNDNFEAPITINQFQEDGELLVATTILISGWERVTSTSGAVYEWLIDKGFTKLAPEPPYWNLSLTANGVITKASWESVIIDAVWFAALNMHFDGYDEAGIDDVTDKFAKFDVQTSGNTLMINAPEFAGNKVTVSDLNGKVIASTIINAYGNEFTVPGNGMYIVKIAGVKSVKVLM